MLGVSPVYTLWSELGARILEFSLFTMTPCASVWRYQGVVVWLFMGLLVWWLYGAVEGLRVGGFTGLVTGRFWDGERGGVRVFVSHPPFFVVG